ncbi:Ubiquitin carboxyl-terminal hydrolase isozyme L5 [Trichoplax sp. H2]|uniref:Ubiquitin carboxyl-terminal hydrolase n=1 Tax=Trichoplax adhaerens TaxID=10228 RepID=B3SA37_TRIAD|nr:hypothetical protein TRIADDRAFT_50992 [Trichoplax adhaerens]EDV20452.1 hypothetical protein TRIADDRAFT_50992 [Trichoplax adhaerens]RDD37481.1 Ubiquitin carboxyl-terminal hydrolase isozyme L5 [Trichoplax sp. H2]|eukprot:XP_002117146.1 hypothetical protein TRIADDRAFT_50992 [Trichoplax adhaerens]
MADDDGAGNWCLIDSDPRIFTELIKGFGVTGVQVEELWSLEKEEFEKLKPIHGLVFLFKWRPGEETVGSLVQDSRQIYFAKQVINNACATQAVLSVLLNCNHKDVQLGEMLYKFKEFSADFDPTMRGLSLSNMDIIRQVHNSFARQQMFEFENSSNKSEEAFHFVAYVPINGRLYELDGLKDGPIDLGKCGEDWITAVKPILESRMTSYATGEIRFNLMAVVSDHKMKLEADLEKLQSNLSDLEGKLSKLDTKKDTEAYLKLKNEYATVELKMNEANHQLRVEEEKRLRYKIEHAKRDHNYLPMIVQLLKCLAKDGRLVELTEKAEQRQKAVTAAALERRKRKLDSGKESSDDKDSGK